MLFYKGTDEDPIGAYHFHRMTGNFRTTNNRDKIEKSTDFRFNVKIVNLFLG